MLKSILGEFTMILSLLKILFPYLCLFLIINMCSLFHKGYRCVYWFLRLVLDQSMCRRKLGFISVVFILICIKPLLLARNAYKFCALIFSCAKVFCLLAKVCLLVIRTSGYCWSN
jgi:hypothetical protein